MNCGLGGLSKSVCGLDVAATAASTGGAKSTTGAIAAVCTMKLGRETLTLMMVSLHGSASQLAS